MKPAACTRTGCPNPAAWKPKLLLWLETTPLEARAQAEAPFQMTLELPICDAHRIEHWEAFSTRDGLASVASLLEAGTRGVKIDQENIGVAFVPIG